MSDLKLLEAVKAGNYVEAGELVKNEVDMNQQDEQGWTPLNFAAGNGNLHMVKLLVENGADILKVGRDGRTPYMIALAAGRVSVASYLKEAEDRYPGEKPVGPERRYCKFYYLKDLRKYTAWSESRINWKKSDSGDAGCNGDPDGPFADDKIVFIHEDFTVTESVWHNENVLFNNVDSDWKEFCSKSLGFRVPTDLDLIVPNES